MLQQIVSSHGFDKPDATNDDDEDYEEGDVPLPVKVALRNILFNELTDDTPNPGYDGAAR